MGKFERGSFPESIRWKKILAQRPAAADINDPGGFKLVDAKSFWKHCNLQEVEEQIRHDFSQFEGPRDLLDSIPGIDQTAAYAILAEIGSMMGSFPTAQYICSWAGLAPGNYESSGKKKNSVLTQNEPLPRWPTSFC